MSIFALPPLPRNIKSYFTWLVLGHFRTGPYWHRDASRRMSDSRCRSEQHCQYYRKLDCLEDTCSNKNFRRGYLSPGHDIRYWYHGNPSTFRALSTTIDRDTPLSAADWCSDRHKDWLKVVDLRTSMMTSMMTSVIT